jgi:hypothetical protein
MPFSSSSTLYFVMAWARASGSGALSRLLASLDLFFTSYQDRACPILAPLLTISDETRPKPRVPPLGHLSRMTRINVFAAGLWLLLRYET